MNTARTQPESAQRRSEVTAWCRTLEGWDRKIARGSKLQRSFVSQPRVATLPWEPFEQNPPTPTGLRHEGTDPSCCHTQTAGAFSLVELLVAGSIIALLAVMLTGAGWHAYKASSLAVSANNIRQLAAGGAAYLADNNYRFWKYRTTNDQPTAVVWWFGLEPEPRPEGQRLLQPENGPLGGYVPAALRPDPSFRLSGLSFKPKYQFGYIGIGYNTQLGGGWMPGTNTPVKSYWDLPRPGEIVVFATSAQINTFQAPASPKKPMIEEFYGIDDGGQPWFNPASIHFRHAGFAMVGFADGSAGFLPMDKSTLDPRAPKAAIARFAPKGSTKYLLPPAE